MFNISEMLSILKKLKNKLLNCKSKSEKLLVLFECFENENENGQ